MALPPNPSAQYLTNGDLYVIQQFQRHILDVAIWSRALLIALKFNLPNTGEVYQRLITEPDDTHEIMSTFFGEESATQYENYLIQLINCYTLLAEALLTNNASQANINYQCLTSVANDIAAFFYQLMPASDADTWKMLFRDYVDMLYREISTIISGNFTEDIELFDSIINQSYLIADYISKTAISGLQPPS